MKIIPTGLDDCLIIEPQVLGDNRGYFFESFNQSKFSNLTGSKFNIVQENQSRSYKNVLRGLHFQIGDSAQSKIVRVLEGEVLDVVVDIRKNSPTYGKHFKIILSAASKKQLFVPKGFAHGFLILSDFAEFFYGVDHGYNPQDERGIMYNDPYFNIDWELTTPIISDRDKKWPSYNENTIYFD